MPPSAFDDLVIFALEDRLRQFQLGHLLAVAEFDFGARAQLPERRQHRAFVQALQVLVLLHHLVNHVHDPRADGLHQHLRAFALQEVEHVEVAVALGGLRPEFAGDLDDGLHAQAVDLDRVEPVAAALQRRNVIVALELVDELADVFGGVGEAAQVLRHACLRASTAASCGTPRAGSPWIRRARGRSRRRCTS